MQGRWDNDDYSFECQCGEDYYGDICEKSEWDEKDDVAKNGCP